MKTLILFYSTYGHIFQMAKAIAEGASSVEGTEVLIRRVPETLSNELLESIGALEAQKAFADIPIVTIDDLSEADAIIFGTPTRFGNMAAQMKAFLDSTGGLWAKGALIGKVGSVFTSTATQHGGQESTILNFHTLLLHHGFIIVGLPYSFQEQMSLDGINGSSPYGATTITGGQGERMPSELELNGARFQGKHVAEITKKLTS